MRYRFVSEHVSEFPVGRICRVLKISRSGYYAWRMRPESKHAQEDARIVENIRAVHAASRETYGSPRVHRSLRRDGITCSRNRVARLMKLYGLSARKKRRFVRTTDSSHNLPIAANLLGQDFDVAAANRVWASDITYVPTDEGWLYLSVVMDLFSRRIIGWSMAETLVSSLVSDAVRMAALRRTTDGVIFHSDRGCQYASDDVRGLVRRLGMQPSMSRRGNCYDNAPLESFFGTLKTERVHSTRYSNRDQARVDIFDYIEVFYNRQRLHSSLDYQSPADFEAMAML